MSEKAENQNQGSESAKRASVNAMTLRRISEYEIKYRRRIREDLENSLSQHVDETRSRVVEEVKQNMLDTLHRQLEQFVLVERELVFNLNSVLTGKYQDILNTYRERNIQLFFHLKLVKERVVSASERVERNRFVEILLDVLFTLTATVIPFCYEFLIPVKVTPLIQYVIPVLYIFLIIGLLIGKFNSYRGRTSETKALTDFVEDEYNKAEKLNPLP